MNLETSTAHCGSSISISGSFSAMHRTDGGSPAASSEVDPAWGLECAAAAAASPVLGAPHNAVAMPTQSMIKSLPTASTSAPHGGVRVFIATFKNMHPLICSPKSLASSVVIGMPFRPQSVRSS